MTECLPDKTSEQSGQDATLVVFRPPYSCPDNPVSAPDNGRLSVSLMCLGQTGAARHTGSSRCTPLAVHSGPPPPPSLPSASTPPPPDRPGCGRWLIQSTMRWWPIVCAFVADRLMTEENRCTGQGKCALMSNGEENPSAGCRLKNRRCK